ncbi:hypothetical protein D9M71_648400 [compost metagenome]
MAETDDQEGRADQQQPYLGCSGGTTKIVGEPFELWGEGLPGPGEMRGDAGPRQALGAFVHEATDELPFVA